MGDGLAHEPPGEEETDHDVVARFRQGDQAAFAILVDRHGPTLYRFLVGWLRRPDLAEEIAQASLVKAAIRIDQLGEGQAFLSWLMTISRTTALDHLRANKPERNISLDAAPERSSTPSTDVSIDVRRVLDGMEPDDREILLMSDYLQLAMEELATSLEIGLSAAKMRVKRARDRFRALYLQEAA